MYQQYMNQVQAKLTSLSSEDLNILLYDDSKLEDRVNEVVRLVNMIDGFYYTIHKFHLFITQLQISSLESEKEVILAANRSIAEENLAKEPTLIEKRGNINDLSAQGKELCQSIQELLATMSNKINRPNLYV